MGIHSEPLMRTLGWERVIRYVNNSLCGEPLRGHLSVESVPGYSPATSRNQLMILFPYRTISPRSAAYKVAFLRSSTSTRLPEGGLFFKIALLSGEELPLYLSSCQVQTLLCYHGFVLGQLPFLYTCALKNQERDTRASNFHRRQEKPVNVPGQTWRDDAVDTWGALEPT